MKIWAPLLGLVALHLSCSASSTPEPAGKHMDEAPKGKHMANAPQTRDAAVVLANSPPSCTMLKCLERHEGGVVQVIGVYEYPKQKAFATNKLVLHDGTRVIVGGPRQGDFVTANDGLEMRITGRAFTKDIPAKYGIIGRSSEPYLLDITTVEVRR